MSTRWWCYSMLFSIALHGAPGATVAATPPISRGASEIALSYDGTEIIFSLAGRLWRVSSRGGEAERLVRGEDWQSQAALSSDGQFVAYRVDRATAPELAVLNRRTGEVMTAWPPNQSEPGDYPRWMSVLPGVPMEGFAFAADGSRLHATHLGGLIDLNPFTRRYTLRSDVRLNRFSISSDGRFALSHWWGPTFEFEFPRLGIEVAKLELHRLAIVDLGTFQLTPVVVGRGREFADSVFSRDGRFVYFVARRGGEEQIIETDRAGSYERVVVAGIDAGREVEAYPDGRRLLTVEDGELVNVDIATGRKTNVPFHLTLEDPPPPDCLVISNATLFSGESSEARPGATVVLRNGAIAEVSYGTSAETRRCTERIDAHGRFLMAGLVDSHTHIGWRAAWEWQDYLHLGITSVSDAATSFPSALDRRLAVEKGLLAGPRPFLMSSGFNGDGHTGRSVKLHAVTDPQLARQQVRRFKRLGYDGIKIYSELTPDVSVAAIDEARKLGLPVVGHLGATTWLHAIEAGISSIAHLSNHFAACEAHPGAGNFPYEEGAPDRVCLEKTFAAMARRGVTLDPTLGLTSMQRILTDRQNQRPLSDSDARRFEWRRETLLMAHRAGVNIVIGRDTERWSLVREMELYEAFGMPRHDILRAATVNPAKFLRRDREFGTVAAGLRADLILVDGNPLARIADLNHLSMVIQGGRIVRR